jgi:isopenicillin-N epimerase
VAGRIDRMAADAFTPEEVRALRSLWPLDPVRAFTNHGSYGGVPHPVLNVAMGFAERIARNPNAFFVPDRVPLLPEALSSVATFVGADPEGVAFVPNVTTAASVLAASMRFQAGDEIVVTSHGYGAVTMAMQRYAADAGARVVTARLSLTPTTEEIASAIAEVTTRHTRLVVLDHITSMPRASTTSPRLPNRLPCKGFWSPSTVRTPRGPST